MTTFVLATNAESTSEILCEYLAGRLDPGDVVHAVNSQVGGDETSAEDIREGEAALSAVADRLDDLATVERHQFVRGNAPAEDVLQAADELDADELVIGIRKRNPTAKLVFGSVAQSLLVQSNYPMAVVPREQA